MENVNEKDILIVIRTGAMETAKHLEDGDVLEIMCEALSHFCESAQIPPAAMLAHFDSKNTDN